MKVRSIIVGVSLGALLFSCAKQEAKVEDAKPSKASTLVQNTSNTKEAKQPEAPKEYAQMDFSESVHDFGNIMQGDVVKHKFTFTNTGKVPLLISDIKTTCGCTTPSYTKTPIKPGENGEIDVQFNSAGKSGATTKNITVLANVEGGSERLLIKCNIEKKEELDGPFKKNSTK